MSVSSALESAREQSANLLGFCLNSRSGSSSRDFMRSWRSWMIIDFFASRNSIIAQVTSTRLTALCRWGTERTNLTG